MQGYIIVFTAINGLAKIIVNYSCQQVITDTTNFVRFIEQETWTNIYDFP
jgi:hypothetical protein